MASLSAHLRRPNDHGRLAFHPECPLCAGERLAGPLPPGAMLGRRSQALLASGVLAMATATPGVAFAVDPNQQRDGTTPPEQGVAGAPPGDSGFDPGGESTDLPFDAGPAPETPDTLESDEDSAALEPQAVTGNETPAVEPVDVDQQPAPPTTAAAPLPPEAASPTPIPEQPSSAPTPEPPATAPTQPETGATTPPPQGASAPPRADEQETEPKTTRRALETQRQPARASAEPYVAPATAPTTVQVAQTQPRPSSSPTNRRHAAKRGDRFHVVQRNESLWSIASDMLGESASPARIAREVNRLWELNSARIGTGDPDLLMAGTRLELR
jgi:hypothetical protein